MDAVFQAIASLGFPIVVAVICMWYVAKQTELHKQETEALAESIAQNTLVLQRLVDRLDGKVGDPE